MGIDIIIPIAFIVPGDNKSPRCVDSNRRHILFRVVRIIINQKIYADFFATIGITLRINIIISETISFILPDDNEISIRIERNRRISLSCTFAIAIIIYFKIRSRFRTAAIINLGINISLCIPIVLPDSDKIAIAIHCQCGLILVAFTKKVNAEIFQRIAWL